tara:strand:- start:327 stop:455 length:129 start_codon:yes stop_codon:yes gene_type:complete
MSRSSQTETAELKRHLKALNLKVSGSRKECEKRLEEYLISRW